MNEIDQLLVSLVAQTYSLFWPCRTGEGNAVRYERRQAYHRSGIAWSGSSSGRDSRSWKSNERERQAIADAGFAKIMRRNGQAFGLKLTVAGEARARGLLLMPDWSLVTAAFARLKSLSNSQRGQSAYNQNWTREDELFRQEYETGGRESDWQEQTETLLPLLIRNAAIQNRAGARIWYSFVKDVALPTDDATDIEPSVEANELFIRNFESSYLALAAATPNNTSELGQLPLSAGTTRGGSK